ncbi:hypothetical protein SCLCIDRAFT_125341 [Scleroderma citrinum Foug A]|uniref:NAD(P)-binding protein n=1 Tax=Scleroderma citrinum Foug A TaxID=1036808 RepID=A0A0C3A578_9AGAM|nr:hypothetical protein SCLCIDRAFT_125341 [Scleroderma citrinum Foug A]
MGSSTSKDFNPEQDIPNLTGKVIIITGGNTGIGYGTIKHLARKGARVYMAAQNKARAEAAISALNKEGLGLGNGEVVWLELNLSNPCNAKKAAKEFMAKEDRLDVLIHNAAMYVHRLHIPLYSLLTFVLCSIISPFILTQELLPVLKKTSSQSGSDIRVIIVSSEGHRVMVAIPHFRMIEDLNDECNHSWSLTKAANILYASELHHRLSSDPSSNIIALSLHPGQVNTWSNKPWVVHLHLSGVIYALRLPITVGPKIGAYTNVFAAAAPVVKREWENGYILPIGRVVKPTVGVWKGGGKELWEVIERFLEERGI